MSAAKLRNASRRRKAEPEVNASVEPNWFTSTSDLISTDRLSRRTCVSISHPIGGLNPDVKRIRAMVSAHSSLQLSRGCSHDPKVFFSQVLRKLIGCKAVKHTIESVKSRRDLVVPHNAEDWEGLVDRKVNRASTIVRGLMTDAYVLGFRGLTQADVDEQCVRWMVLDWTGNSTSQLKTHLLWLSGRQRNVDAPTTGLIDLAGLVLTPKYRRWCLQKLRAKRAVSVTTPYGYDRTQVSPDIRSKQHGAWGIGEVLSETFLQGTKRSQPSVEDDDLPAKEKEYFDAMSTDKPMSGTWGAFMRDEIARTAREVFGSDSDVPYEPYNVSIKAGFKAPRYSGGILGACIRGGWIVPEDVLVKMAEFRARVWEVRAVLCDARDLYEHARVQWSCPVKEGGEDNLADCQIYWIREPLKVRTITAGTADLYGALPPLLRHLRRGMARFECFKLTRQECDWSAIEARLNQLPSFKGDMFESDDFQASTNEMSMWATLTAIYEAFGGRSYGLAEAALGAQRIHGQFRKGESIIQANGQLMGSFISFPVLCVVNAAVGRAAYELTLGRRLGLDECPFLVNGDDYLGRSDDNVRAYRLLLMGAVGWRQSPGKSYYLPDLVQINSQTRHVIRIRDQFGLTMVKVTEPIPYLNGGFIHQMGKDTRQMDGPCYDDASDFRARWDSFGRLTGSGWEFRTREVTLDNLRRIARQLYSSKRTPFIIEPLNPCEYGGMGLTDTIHCWEAARWGLACRRPKVESAVLNCGETSRPEDSPILEKVRSVVPMSRLLDALVDDLDRAVEAGCRYKPVCPLGFLDPIVRQIGPTMPSLPAHCRNAVPDESLDVFLSEETTLSLG